MDRQLVAVLLLAACFSPPGWVYSASTREASSGESSSSSTSTTPTTGPVPTTGGEATSTAGSSGASSSTSTGTTGSAPTCPPVLPEAGSACTVGDTCSYDGEQCRCYASPMFDGWACRPCPVEQPEPGPEPCTPLTANCSYGLAQCTCFADGPWTCSECPPEQPAGACEVDGLACDYGETHCECFDGAWAC